MKFQNFLIFNILDCVTDSPRCADTHKSGELTVIRKFVSKKTGLDGSDSVNIRTGQSSRGGGGGEGTVSLSIDIIRSDICKIGCWKCACLQLPEKWRWQKQPVSLDQLIPN